jgi:hypothetical protein
MQTSRATILRNVVVFTGHQLVATLGIIVGTAVLAFTAYPAVRFFDHNVSMRSVHWVLTETPYFPLQIIEGLIIGYLGYFWFKHAVMCWVWVWPLLWLMLFFFSAPSSVVTENTWIVRLDHFFGQGCNPRMIPPCFDQLVTTLPFYVSLAYSTGAYAERIGLFRFEHPDDTDKKASE